MKTYRLLSAAALVITIASTSPVAYAARNDFTIKTGGGEELTIKNGLFGGKQKVVKDRFGDKYESKKGWFGTKQSKVSVLGNHLETKKGLLGSSEVEATSILGDKVTTKKGWFGRRKTTVELAGVSSMIGQLFKRKPPTLSVPQSQMPGNAQAPLSTDLRSSQIPAADAVPPDSLPAATDSSAGSMVEDVQGWSQ